jgi:hypothetical protein
MAEVHLPNLDKDGDAEQQVPIPAPAPPARRRKSLLTIGLEVVLITAGVFLGLMGEQWRERMEQGELAEASLRRFRTEILNNRRAVAAVVDYHTSLRKDLEAYFSANDRSESSFKVKLTMGLAPVFFEEGAWDLALATQSLAHIEPDLAFAISRLYTTQRGYTDLQKAIVQSTVYGRSYTSDFDGFWRSIMWYLGDTSYFDPLLIKTYDEVLPQIDRALGESSSPSQTSK